MIAVDAMSTLSHVFQSPRLRKRFRAIDQGTNYLLIAGTYTSFSLAYLHSCPWWILLGVICYLLGPGVLAQRSHGASLPRSLALVGDGWQRGPLLGNNYSLWRCRKNSSCDKTPISIASELLTTGELHLRAK